MIMAMKNGIVRVSPGFVGVLPTGPTIKMNGNSKTIGPATAATNPLPRETAAPSRRRMYATNTKTQAAQASVMGSTGPISPRMDRA